MTTSSPKLCRDCKWMRREWLMPLYSKCRAPQNREHDLVLGREIWTYDFCRTQRSDPTTDITCGPEGKWFKPK